MAISEPKDSKGRAESLPNPHLWSRDGFVGDHAVALRAAYTPEYLSVDGPHAPRRFDLNAFEAEDAEDPSILPHEIFASKKGIKVSVSRRRTPTPFTLRNCEADELHFVQSGRCRFDTDFGSIEAEPLDFVCIPRAISYRIEPLSTDLIDLVLESPAPLKFDTPAPFGMVNFGAAVRRAELAQDMPASPGPHILFVKTEDGVTRYEMAADPLPAIAQVAGLAPIWALNLANIVQINYGESGGPPEQFLSTGDTDVMIYSLSARPGRRPPVHHNADYDEIVIFAAGPGAWGKVTEPGTLAWVPKGVTHQGPSEDVPEGYQAWLIETRATLRVSESALEQSVLMETGLFGPQPTR